ncbi:endocuticle structural glycoprotein SgAbd-1-like [Bacillus rossius redtenbacheri]|uniref:endocuticle structural glycoprotein SgAbd-1-like n=1 Tax=Bacillus rossius redtenbacheri TaxID=93214 RepID=UPI002FDE064C
MKLIIASCLLCAALAAPQLRPEPVPIISQSNIVNEDGSFQNSYESADGTRVDSQGALKSLGPQEDGQVIQGSYSFVGTDGAVYQLTYTADENGFQPQANYLPTPPPIPEKILEALAYNAAHPEEDNLKRK